MKSRRLFIALLFTTILCVSQSVNAQLNRDLQAPEPATIRLTMQDQHVLKEVLLKESTSNQSLQIGLEPGTIVPDQVVLRSFPQYVADKIPHIRSHRYFITSNSLVIVQPEQRSIVAVVSKN